MIRALEVGRAKELPDQETPSNEYLSQLLEMVEEDDLVACHLDEVISKAESSTLQLQTSLDQAGRLRVSRQRPKGKLPQTTEELRRKLRIKGVQKQNLELQHFDRFVDYLFGDRCYNLHVVSFTGERVPLKPHWHVLLTYEYELRKRAIKDAYKKQLSLGVTLKQVCADAELKELYFTRPEKFQKFGFGKGNKGQSTLPGTNLRLASKTPDGREICFRYNMKGLKCDGRCKRLHVCRVQNCHKAHPAFLHDSS